MLDMVCFRFTPLAHLFDDMVIYDTIGAFGYDLIQNLHYIKAIVLIHSYWSFILSTLESLSILGGYLLNLIRSSTANCLGIFLRHGTSQEREDYILISSHSGRKRKRKKT